MEMTCSYCGSDFECVYVVEWLGIDGDDDDHIREDISDTPRAPGSLCVAVPFAPDKVAVVDLPTPSGGTFRADPLLWNATQFAMVTRRRRSAPCLAHEHRVVFEWAAKGIYDALGKHAAITTDLPPDDPLGCPFTARQAAYARTRIRLFVVNYMEVLARQREEEEEVLRMTQHNTRLITTASE